LQEIRKYPTRFPHIVIERTDMYTNGNREVPEQIQWYARRVQNHRRNLRLNNMLDVASLGFEVARLLIYNPSPTARLGMEWAVFARRIARALCESWRFLLSAEHDSPTRPAAVRRTCCLSMPPEMGRLDQGRRLLWRRGP